MWSRVLTRVSWTINRSKARWTLYWSCMATNNFNVSYIQPGVCRVNASSSYGFSMVQQFCKLSTVTCWEAIIKRETKYVLERKLPMCSHQSYPYHLLYHYWQDHYGHPEFIHYYTSHCLTNNTIVVEMFLDLCKTRYLHWFTSSAWLVRAFSFNWLPPHSELCLYKIHPPKTSMCFSYIPLSLLHGWIIWEYLNI